MPALSSLVPEVRTHLSSAPQPTVIIYLRNAAQQFARKSQVWRVRLGARTISDADIDADAEYTTFVLPDDDFTLPAESGIWAISRMRLDGKDLDDFEFDEETSELGVRSADLRAGELEVRAALQPTDGAANIPDTLAGWHVGITSHAIAAMMMMPGEPWSAPRLAPRFTNLFLGEVTAAIGIKSKRRTRRPLRTARIPVA